MEQFTAIVVTAAGAKQVKDDQNCKSLGFCLSDGIGTSSEEWTYS